MSKIGIICVSLLAFFAGNVFLRAQTKSVEVPMKVHNGMPAIEVMVNGQGPFLFAIDTGGQGDARADESLVKTLGLKKIREVQAGDSSGKTIPLEMVRINSIKIGDFEFRNLEALSRGYNSRSGVKIDGILGFELFKNHLLTLDYPAKKVRIEEGILPVANGKDILNFESPRGIPVVEISIGNKKLKAHIDSGNSTGGFILPTQMVEKLELATQPTVIGKAQTVVNTFEIKSAKLIDTISFGGFEYTAPTVIYPGPSPSEANIGAMILRDFVLIFDQKNRRVKLAKKMWKEEPVAVRSVNIAFKDYVGQYGDRTISDDGESLYLQRPNGMKLKLVAAEKDEYTIEVVPNAKVKFVRDESGKIIEINVLTPDGTWQKAKKN